MSGRVVCWASLVAASIGLLAGEARAQIPPVQWQLVALGSVDAELESVQAEVQANLGIFGVGLALGLGGEALGRATGGWEGGGFLDLAIQLRPLMLYAALRESPLPAYFIFDPHLDVGGLFGAVSDEGEAAWRGVFYIGAALDFGIPTGWYRMASQVLLSLGYRFVPVQAGREGLSHHFVLGLGYRAGY